MRINKNTSDNDVGCLVFAFVQRECADKPLLTLNHVEQFRYDRSWSPDRPVTHLVLSDNPCRLVPLPQGDIPPTITPL